MSNNNEMYYSVKIRIFSPTKHTPSGIQLLLGRSLLSSIRKLPHGNIVGDCALCTYHAVTELPARIECHLSKQLCLLMNPRLPFPFVFRDDSFFLKKKCSSATVQNKIAHFPNTQKTIKMCRRYRRIWASDSFK